MAFASIKDVLAQSEQKVQQQDYLGAIDILERGMRERGQKSIFLDRLHTILGDYRGVIYDRLAFYRDTQKFISEAGTPGYQILFGRHKVLRAAIDLVGCDGLWIELGVYFGDSIRTIAAGAPGPVHGFDSFQGLPEDFDAGDPYVLAAKGAYSTDGVIPEVPDNARLYPGWFADSLPPFLGQQPGKIAFLHVDCDIYSSASDAFICLADRFQAGSVIVLDDYYNYPKWRQQIHQAFEELLERLPLRADYVLFGEYRVAAVLR